MRRNYLRSMVALIMLLSAIGISDRPLQAQSTDPPPETPPTETPGETPVEPVNESPTDSQPSPAIDSMTVMSGSDVTAQGVLGDISTDQIIVRFRTPSATTGPASAGVLATQLAELNTSAASELAGEPLSYLRTMGGGEYVLKLPRTFSSEQLRAIVAQLAARSDVELVEPDVILYPVLVPNDQFFSLQWDLAAPVPGNYGANLPAAWDITTGNPSMVIAVLDTGQLNHADLAGRFVAGYDMINDLPRGNDGDLRDSDPSDPGDWVTAAEAAAAPFLNCQVKNSTWHGTHVAGTIGANGNNAIGVAGINWQSKLQHVRVLGKCGGYLSDTTDGISWAAGFSVLGVPTNTTPARVINMSLGGVTTCSATMQNAINAAVNAGVVVVAAAGNNGNDAATFTPGNCANVITVAATGKAGNRAGYSNFGTAVEIAAPGGDFAADAGVAIASTLNTGTTAPLADTYVYFQGTSQATPHVAGIASLMLAVNPSLTPTQVLQILQSTVTAFPAGSTCTTTTCGAGIVNAAAAVAQANALFIPGAYGKTGPANAATGQPISITLSWGASANASSYEYCIDTTNNNTCDATWTSTGITRTANVTGLTYSTAYYWQVRATNTAGSTEADASAWWSFNTLSPPLAFNKSSPANAATGQTISLALSWGASGGAGNYEYCIDTTNNSTCNATWVSTGAGTSASISGLAYSTVYYWQVRANNAAGSTLADAGAWWSFTTQVPPPGAFIKSSPVNAATAQATTLTLSWGASSGATSYSYCRDTVNNNVCDGTWTSTGAATSASVAGLANGTTYFWQVRATNVTGNTEANANVWWSFTTQVALPGVFNKTSPANAATGQPVRPTLRWGASTGATRYEYCIDTSNNNACNATWVNVGNVLSRVLPTALTRGATYYWTVRSVNAAGSRLSNNGTWWRFTVIP